MAGRGPIPKPRQLRQGHHQAVVTTLPATGSARRRAPRLPADRTWRPATVRWWRDIWRSPMASQWLDTDVHELVRLAVLVDAFDVAPTPQLATEIRLQRERFGLDPASRRRLGIEIELSEQEPGAVAAWMERRLARIRANLKGDAS